MPVCQLFINFVSVQQGSAWNQVLPSMVQIKPELHTIYSEGRLVNYSFHKQLFFLQESNKIHPKRHPSHFLLGEFCYLPSLKNAASTFCTAPDTTGVQTLSPEYFPKKEDGINPLSMIKVWRAI